MGNKYYAEVPLGGGFFGLANTKWSYAKNKNGAEIGYANRRELLFNQI